MIATQSAESKSKHPLSRFVTTKAIALLLNLETKDIYRIDCWRYVIHVVGKGISTFVSYADLPPILGVESPTERDFVQWRKRWRKNDQQVPKFWLDFYKQKFKQAVSVAQLYAWGKIVGLIKSLLSPMNVQQLRSVYIEIKNSLKPAITTAI